MDCWYARCQGGKGHNGKGVSDGVVPAITNINKESAILEFSPPLSFDEGENEITGFSLCTEGKPCVFTKAVQTGAG
jgi:hypothetical protein